MNAFELIFVCKPTHLSLRRRAGFGGYGGDRFNGDGNFTEAGGSQSGYVREMAYERLVIVFLKFTVFFTRKYSGYGDR